MPFGSVQVDQVFSRVGSCCGGIGVLVDSVSAGCEARQGQALAAGGCGITDFQGCEGWI